MITPMRNCFPAIVPLVYDDSLSYIEFLAQVQAKVNEVINQVNNIETDLQEQIDTSISVYAVTVNQQLDDLKSYVDTANSTLKSEVTTYVSEQVDYIYNLFSDFTSSVNAKILEIQSAMANLQTLLTSSIAYLTAYIDSENSKQNVDAKVEYGKIYDYIDNISKTYPPVFNPITGTYTNVETTILDMYSSFRYFAFTCTEFDNSGITCAEYDSKLITAINYDLYGKLFFEYFEKLTAMTNPYTGVQDTVKNVIYETSKKTTLLTINCTDYESLHITATDYDNKLITAYNFDFYGLKILNEDAPVFIGIWENGKNLYSLSGVVEISTQTTEVTVDIPATADIISLGADINVNDIWYSLNGDIGEYYYNNGTLSINLTNVPSASYQLRYNITYNN